MSGTIILPWTVEAGGPNCGKTTNTNILEFWGNPVVHEPASVLLGNERVDIEWLRARMLRMQESIASFTVATHTKVHNRDVRELGGDIPRVVDTTALEAKAHCLAAEIPPSPFLEHTCKVFRYDSTVFLFEPTPWESNAIRPPEDFARRVHEFTGNIYVEEGYTVVPLPLMSRVDRARIVQAALTG